MSPPILIITVLCVLCVIMMILERMGLPTTLQWHMKGDLKRETRFVAQYGQLVCTFFTAILIWQLDKNWYKVGLSLWASVGMATGLAIILKRVLRRARPRCENAGKFLFGFSLKNDNARESFPSSHSASAMAYGTVLALAYPQAAATFWGLAIMCAVLRYIMDAHWPSDVLAGCALGLAAGLFACHYFHVV